MEVSEKETEVKGWEVDFTFELTIGTVANGDKYRVNEARDLVEQMGRSKRFEVCGRSRGVREPGRVPAPMSS